MICFVKNAAGQNSDKLSKAFSRCVIKIHFKMLIYWMEKHWRKVLTRSDSSLQQGWNRGYISGPWPELGLGSCSQVTVGVDEWPLCPHPGCPCPSPAGHTCWLTSCSSGSEVHIESASTPLRSTPLLPCSQWCQTFHPSQIHMEIFGFSDLYVIPTFFSPWQPQIEPNLF